MSLLKPEITVTLFPRKKASTSEPTKEPTPVIDIDAAKAAANELGKKFFIGAGAVALATVAAATAGAIAVVSVNHALNK